MRVWQLILFLMVATFFIRSGVLRADSPPPTGEEKKTQLDKIRQDQGQYSRLLRDAKAFSQLSPEEQDRLRQLDRDMHKEKWNNANRLQSTLKRYAQWVESLPDVDREKIESA